MVEQRTSFTEFKERLRENERPVIVDVWAPWCAPCRSLAPGLERARQAHKGRVDVWKLNADERIDLVRELGVRGVPTLIAFQGEREIARRTGMQSPSQLKGLFEAALTGEATSRVGPAPVDRLVRLLVGFVLLGFGLLGALSPLLIALGGVVLFSAVHDRCPLWQAIKPQVARLARRSTG